MRLVDEKITLTPYLEDYEVECLRFGKVLKRRSREVSCAGICSAI
jgi:hypothetical protein